ncbi:MAG: GNAT family N-acetyltransferase [Desulfurococcales archaeon]|nr:GNAT family N-acetyltransferase [Desulfurococcales archaeon]MCE4622614.1 GNAT family N-acetyltransferase [Desulfurococcales archaeon]MCE4626790.1 GNAT family N-acetyltransferase [Desulfurococcales archaeon]MCE4629274.1 GNAT family N-acetyltransferase [Desulfurococcales archaeon]
MESLEAKRHINFRVRRATREDIPSVMAVNLRSLPENYWYGFYEYILMNWPESFLVAEVDDVIVGYAMSRVEDTGDPLLLGLFDENITPLYRQWLEPRKAGHLVSIAVLKEYRGRGIGSALLSETIEVMKTVYKVESLFLEVRVSNTPAINLYKKFGFKIVRRIPYYYRDGEDAYVMVIRLAPRSPGDS